MNIFRYESASGKDIIREYIDSLPTEEQVDADHVMKDMEDGNFDRIKTKTWSGKIKEVYFKKHNRLFYIIVSGKDIYILHACRKQKNKTEKETKI